MQVHIHFNAVGDLYERDSAIHAVFLTVKSHYPLDLAYARSSFAAHRQGQGFGFGNSANGKGTRYAKRIRPSLLDLCRFERDVRIVLGVEKVFTFQLTVLHTASGIHARRLSLDL